MCRVPGCVAAQQCGSCLSDLVGSMSGVAQRRGETWARSVAARRPDLRGQPWPDDERARAIARSKGADLSSDPRVAEQLEGEVMRGARRWWDGFRQPS